MSRPEFSENGIVRKDITMKKKTFIKDLIVLFIALAALVCAALNLHVSLKMLETKEEE